MSAKAAARRRALVIGAALVSSLVSWSDPLAGPSSAFAANIDRGEKLFRHVWEPGDLAAGQGDGLGPMYNERSCIACHFLGGAGGAGTNQQNVHILTADPPKEPKYFPSLTARLSKVHSGFGRGTSIVLHRYSTDQRYGPFHKLLTRPATSQPASTHHISATMAKPPAKRLPAYESVRVVSRNGVRLYLTQRSTTPLFGVGLIDEIPEAAINDMATTLSVNDVGVSGRFVGRFGWRGQVRDLRTFVLGACAVEIGLQNEIQTQAADPLVTGPRMVHADISAVHCEDLIAYVASLKRPGRAAAENSLEAIAIQHGETLFETVGCAACHVRQLGSVDRLYSNLLLHDMGTRLEDPASAATFASSEYYGPPPDLTSPFAAERRREWKTPPLWGLRDSKPYLHDGRAETVEEAISWHGGEASDSLNRYVALSAEDRSHVLLFLSTLRAPRE